jgi:hypothetical protein
MTSNSSLRNKIGLKGHLFAYKEEIQQKVTAYLTSIPKLLPEECPLLEQMCICRSAGLKRVTREGFICILFITKYAQGLGTS